MSYSLSLIAAISGYFVNTLFSKSLVIACFHSWIGCLMASVSGMVAGLGVTSA